MAPGFSTRTCLPAFSARQLIGASEAFGVAIMTTSTAGQDTASSTESVATHPGLDAASCFARLRSTSHTTGTEPAGRAFIRFLAIRPQPMRATFGLGLMREEGFD